MKKEDIEKLNIETEHGVFTPVYKYDSGDGETEIYNNIVILQTAEENYREWLKNKTDMLPEQRPTEIELLAAELSLVLAEQQLQMEMAIAELSIAIAAR